MRRVWGHQPSKLSPTPPSTFFCPVTSGREGHVRGAGGLAGRPSAGAGAIVNTTGAAPGPVGRARLRGSSAQKHRLLQAAENALLPRVPRVSWGPQRSGGQRQSSPFCRRQGRLGACTLTGEAAGDAGEPGRTLSAARSPLGRSSPQTGRAGGAGAGDAGPAVALASPHCPGFATGVDTFLSS